MLIDSGFDITYEVDGKPASLLQVYDAIHTGVGPISFERAICTRLWVQAYEFVFSALLAHGIAFHLDPVGVMHKPVEDTISRRGDRPRHRQQDVAGWLNCPNKITKKKGEAVS